MRVHVYKFSITLKLQVFIFEYMTIGSKKNFKSSNSTTHVFIFPFKNIHSIKSFRLKIHCSQLGLNRGHFGQVKHCKQYIIENI